MTTSRLPLVFGLFAVAALAAPAPAAQALPLVTSPLVSVERTGAGPGVAGSARSGIGATEVQYRRGRHWRPGWRYGYRPGWHRGWRGYGYRRGWGWRGYGPRPYRY